MAQRVVEGVKDALEAGVFAPGQRLVEADLCLRFGVGRTHVREALNRLASENIVDLFPNRGAALRVLTPEQTTDALQLMSLMIGHAARLACERATDDKTRHALRKALAGLDDRKAGLDLLKARQAIHAALIEAARSDELARVVGSLQYLVLQFHSVLPQLSDEMNDDLKAIVEAVLAGETDVAERLARAHILKMDPVQ